MSFVEDKQVVEGLSSRRLHPSLRNRVRPERPERRSHLLNAEPPQATIESRAVATVTIVDQKPRWKSIPSAALHYLLGNPFCRRKWRYRNVLDFLVRVPDYKKDMESLKQKFGRRRNRTPICSIHGASRISANPRMALDCVANSYTLRQSSQKPQTPVSRVRLGSAFDPKVDFLRSSVG